MSEDVTDIDEYKKTREEILAKRLPTDSIKELFMVTDMGKPKTSSAKNVAIILTKDPNFAGKIAYNAFSEIFVKLEALPVIKSSKGPWEDNDISMFRVYVEETYNYSPSTDAIMAGLVSAGYEKKFNPVKDRIEAQEWDGTERVETFFIDYLGASDTAYTREVARVWLSGLIARAYEPGVKFELVPMLSGPQGLGKSSLVGALLPDFFLENLEDMKSKDSYQQLVGKVVVELAELSAMKKTDVDHIKSFLSARSDNFRSAYGRITKDHPRKCVFIGTTNDSGFLKDETGNRRFLPVELSVTKPTKDAFNIDDADMLQVLAEAKVIYDNGQQLFMSKENQETAAELQKSAMVEDPTRDAILEYLEMPVPNDWRTYSIGQRSNYYYSYHRDESLKNRKNVKLTESQLTKMTATTTKEILMVVLNTEQRDLASVSRSGTAKKISMIVSNADGWEASKHVDFNGKDVRGFKRERENTPP